MFLFIVIGVILLKIGYSFQNIFLFICGLILIIVALISILDDQEDGGCD